MSSTILSLKAVNIYQEKNPVLTNVNLEVNRGEFIYLIGKTGAGKSSFLKTLYADLPLTEGEGTIVDYDLGSLKEKDIPYLRRKLGVVFQDFKLLPDRNVKENLLFVLKATGWTVNEEMNVKIDEVLDKVGMKNYQSKMPHQLSGGEQQRVAIARAIAKNPKLLLCDEPTGALDYLTGKAILALLREMCDKYKMTVIVITHNSALAPMADRVIHLKNGKVDRMFLNEHPQPIQEIEW